MSGGAVFVLVLDVLGTFVFALNGALAAVRQVRLDIVGVLVLGALTAVGGGIVRDVLIGDTPPVALRDWWYLSVATAGALIAFFWQEPHRLMLRPILVLDAVGLSLFCVVGAQRALDHGLNPGSAILLGVITAVGGGTLRDLFTRQVPTVLSSGLYAIPALAGAAIATISIWIPNSTVALGIVGAVVCFGIRMVGVRYRLDAPVARAHRASADDPDQARDADSEG